MKGIYRTGLSDGDKIEFGSDIQAIDAQQSGSGLKIVAVSSGEPIEQILISSRFENGDEIELPDDARLLDVQDGSGRANPLIWYLVPMEAYQ